MNVKYLCGIMKSEKIIIRKVDEDFNLDTDITDSDKEFNDRKYFKIRYRENINKNSKK